MKREIGKRTAEMQRVVMAVSLPPCEARADEEKLANLLEAIVDLNEMLACISDGVRPQTAWTRQLAYGAGGGCDRCFCCGRAVSRGEALAIEKREAEHPPCAPGPCLHEAMRAADAAVAEMRSAATAPAVTVATESMARAAKMFAVAFEETVNAPTTDAPVWLGATAGLRVDRSQTEDCPVCGRPAPDPSQQLLPSV